VKGALLLLLGGGLLSVGLPGIWTGIRYGRVRFKADTFWRNAEPRRFWESEISNIAAVGVGFAAFVAAARIFLT
jgi:hypothetical protein